MSSQIRYFVYSGKNYYIQKTDNDYSWQMIGVTDNNTNQIMKNNAGTDLLLSSYETIQVLEITLYSLGLTNLDFVEILDNLIKLSVRNNKYITSIKFNSQVLTYLAPDVDQTGSSKYGFKMLELIGCPLLTSIPINRHIVSLTLNNCSSLQNLTAGTNNTTSTASYPALQYLIIQTSPISSLPLYMRPNTINDYMYSLVLLDTNISKIEYNTRFCMINPRSSLLSTVIDLNFTNIGTLILDDHYTTTNKNNSNGSQALNPNSGNVTSTGYLNSPNIIVL